MRLGTAESELPRLLQSESHEHACTQAKMTLEKYAHLVPRNKNNLITKIVKELFSSNILS